MKRIIDKGMGKALATKIANEMEAEFGKCTELLVYEHGRRVELKVTDLRGNDVSLEKLKEIGRKFLYKEPYNEFDGGSWASCYFGYFA